LYYKTHILDAGAGFGQYTYYLSNINSSWNILSIDVKKEQVSPHLKLKAVLTWCCV